MQTDYYSEVVFENHPNGILLFESCSGKIINCNNSFAKSIGFRKEELIGINSSLIFSENSNQIISDIKSSKSNKTECDGNFFLLLEYLHRDTSVVEKKIQLQIYQSDNQFYFICYDFNTEIKINDEKTIQDKYEFLAANINELLCEINEDLNFIYISKKFEHILGYSKTELIGKPVYTLIQKDDRKRAYKKYNSLIKKSKPIIDVFRLQKKKGSYMIAECQGNVFYSEGKKTIIIVSKDITDEIEIQKSLERVERKYRLLFETMHQGVLFIENNQKIISINKAAAIILGVVKSDLVGNNLVNLNWKFISDDGSIIPFRKISLILEICKNKQIKNTILGLIRQDSKRIQWFKIDVIPINRIAENENTQISILFENITKLKRTKEFERILYKKMKDSHFEVTQRQFAIDQHAIVAITNLAGTILYVNSRFCEISKYSREELLGKNHRIINSGLHPKEFFQDMYKTLNSGNAWMGEIRNKAKDGSYYWVATTIAPLRNANGKIEQYFAIRTNITKRKQAEELIHLHQIELETQNKELQLIQKKLYDERRRYSDLYHLAPIGYFTIDNFGKILDANYIAFSLLGLNLLNKPLSQYIAEEDKDSWDSIFENLYNTGRPQSCELRMLKENKHYFWVLLEITIVEDNNGFPISLIAMTDIEDRKRSEQALRLSESKMQAIFNNSLESILFISPDKKIEFYNKVAAIRNLAVSGKELEIGKSIYEFMLSDDINDFNFYFDLALSGKRTIRDKSYPVNEVNYWFELQYAPVKNEKNESIGVLFTARDINEKKQVEEQLRLSELRFHAIFDQAPLGIALIDSNTGKFIQINPKFCGLLGYNEYEILSKKFLDIAHPEDLDLSNEHWNAVFERGENLTSFEKRYIKKDGSIAWANLIRVPLFEKGEESIYNLLIINDITDSKQTAQTIKKYMQDLENLNQTKDKFFNIIAHDLRNPFSGIIGISEMMQDILKDYKDENKEQFLNYTRMISASSKSAFSLLENLLLWARSQTGEISVKQRNIPIEQLIDYSIPIVTVNAIKKNISLETKIHKNEIVYADESLTGTILRNLLTNAIKFTRSNGKIILSTETKDNFLEVSISDTGVGINQENLARIFRIDSKFSKPGTENEKGTGLGLILCKEFTNKQGGSIRAESEPNLGSKFTFSLPLAI